MAAQEQILTATVVADSQTVVHATPIDEKTPSAPVYGEMAGGATAYDPNSVGQRAYPSPQQMDKLIAMGVPLGLADSLGRAVEATARRYWIVDNSGSMTIPDGNRVLTSGSTKKMISCSRWEELGDSLRWHGQVAATLGAHTEFRMLNHTPTLKTQKVVIGAQGLDSEAGLEELTQAISSTPSSGTPLCAAIRSVVSEIQAIESQLRANNRCVSVIIASDGQASDGDRKAVEAALAPLARLPCDVVVRLCTDQDDVVDYWNEIDNDLELNLDVLDDTAGEGKEVRKVNPWLSYGEVLHRVREFGCAPKVLDFLDERGLYVSEATEVVKLIVGKSAERWPHPEADAAGYLNALSGALKSMNPVFDASQKKVVPWIDVKKFASAVLKKSSCAIS